MYTDQYHVYVDLSEQESDMVDVLAFSQGVSRQEMLRELLVDSMADIFLHDRCQAMDADVSTGGQWLN
jgi:hypothetical protein